MKWWLCLENNCQTGKFEEITLFVAGKKIYIIYIYKKGSTALKRPAKKEEKDEKRESFKKTREERRKR